MSNIKVTEVCNLKDGTNTIKILNEDIGDSIFRQKVLSANEIIDKYSEYLTEKQLSELKAKSMSFKTPFSCNKCGSNNYLYQNFLIKCNDCGNIEQKLLKILL